MSTWLFVFYCVYAIYSCFVCGHVLLLEMKALAVLQERSIADCLDGEKRDLQHQHVEKLVAEALIDTAKPTVTQAGKYRQ